MQVLPQQIAEVGRREATLRRTWLRADRRHARAIRRDDQKRHRQVRARDQKRGDQAGILNPAVRSGLLCAGAAVIHDPRGNRRDTAVRALLAVERAQLRRAARARKFHFDVAALRAVAIAQVRIFRER